MLGVKWTRLTSAGNILAGPGLLHWLVVSNPDSSTRHITLNDAISGTGSEVHKFHTPSARTVVYPFDPPISLNVGIRIGAFEDSDTVVLGGYS
ncbi:hypothetical protein LCGC14_0527170 [marine sediment metagenome]|uniref:Uncharacterized protein n=1 Tax=marine sediment metagenome TaxID=412755 RepID=A0A0F9V4X3_9ZZZZ